MGDLVAGGAQFFYHDLFYMIIPEIATDIICIGILLLHKIGQIAQENASRGVELKVTKKLLPQDAVGRSFSICDTILSVLSKCC